MNNIELIKQALLFYANEDNYNGARDIVGLVEKDRGHQARFALKQIEELDDINEKIKSDYNDIINDAKEEENPENILNIINKIKDIESED